MNAINGHSDMTIGLFISCYKRHLIYNSSFILRYLFLKMYHTKYTTPKGLEKQNSVRIEIVYAFGS